MPIPVVIHHSGDQPYLVKCVELNAKNNLVYLLGDESNRSLFDHHPSVKQVDTADFGSAELDDFKKHFSNYSTHSSGFERLCFERIFMLREFILRTGIDPVFYVDSDCIVLDSVTRIFKQLGGVTCGLSIQKVSNPHHMVACIHNSLLTLEFCEAFIQLCFDVYMNKSKFHLIEPKIEWHRRARCGGGICDMTLYHLLHEQGLVPGMVDFNEPRLIDGEWSVFDHNLSDRYGFLGEKTYELERGTKSVLKKDGKFYLKTRKNAFRGGLYPAKEGTPPNTVRTLSLHFQGSKKRHLEAIDTDTFFSEGSSPLPLFREPSISERLAQWMQKR
jgi:hypothetical protein